MVLPTIISHVHSARPVNPEAADLNQHGIQSCDKLCQLRGPDQFLYLPFKVQFNNCLNSETCRRWQIWATIFIPHTLFRFLYMLSILKVTRPALPAGQFWHAIRKNSEYCGHFLTQVLNLLSLTVRLPRLFKFTMSYTKDGEWFETSCVKAENFSILFSFC